MENIKIKRVKFHNGLPDFILSLDQWHSGGGYQGFIKDNCIAVGMINHIVDDEMSEKDFTLLEAWEG